MKDIKCPSCGKTFRIDPSSFEEILLQIKDEEFNKQIKERLLLAEEDNKKALEILKKLNGKKHNLISSVCISQNGAMIWNYTDKATLTMKRFSLDELKSYLSKITDEALYAYNVYQIEGEGRKLFLNIEGDEDTIMGLPIKKIKQYLSNYE